MTIIHINIIIECHYYYYCDYWAYYYFYLSL